MGVTPSKPLVWSNVWALGHPAEECRDLWLLAKVEAMWASAPQEGNGVLDEGIEVKGSIRDNYLLLLRQFLVLVPY